MYRLQVTKLKKNENYEEEMKNYNPRYGGEVRPSPEHVVDTLLVTLTDDEFQAVKKAVIEVK